MINVNANYLLNADSRRLAWAVGLMTGTVLDGNIDVALIRTDGECIERFGAYTLIPYKSATLELLTQAVSEAQVWQFGAQQPDIFNRVERLLTEEQSAAVLDLMQQAGLAPDAIGGIGFHGQTVLHRPPTAQQLGRTRQLGDGALMACATGVSVVNDFRSLDMAKGGHGAPLSAVYHQALLHQAGATGDTAVLNVGGVANLTWWDGDQQLVAFDTGPGNAPINDFVSSRSEDIMDRDGKLALSGSVDEARLQRMLEHPFFDQSYPKSLDRFAFGWQAAKDLSIEDGAALLTAFSAAAVGKALNLLPQRPERLIVCGGGRHNPALMKALSRYTRTQVTPAETMGWRGDAMEAECFAYLAIRRLRGLPISFPTTTGVSTALCGGVVHHPLTKAPLE